MRPMLLRYLRPEAWLVTAGVVVGIVAAATAGFGLPFMTQYVFPMVFGEAPIPDWLQNWVLVHMSGDAAAQAEIMLWGAALFIPLVMFVRGVATYLNTYLLTKAGMRIMARLRTDIFTRLQWLSFSFHDRRTRGALMTTVLQYTQNLQQQMIWVLNDLVIQPLTLVAALGYLIYAALSSHESAMLLGNLLITAGCVPLVRLVGKRVVKQMRALLKGMNIITATVEESLHAQREVRAFNLQERQEQKLNESISKYNRILVRIATWQQALSPAIEVVSALALAYALYCGSSNGLTLEQFTAIALAFYFCYDPIKKLGTVSNTCSMMGVAIRAINEVLEAKDETPEPQQPKALPQPTQGVVDFRGVNFSYTEEKLVLRDINVHVPAGQIVALVGPSGSGKTTFINLICRFYDAGSGSVCIDGVDVRDLTRAERTGAIALVSQFSALFRDSIRENIRIGRPGASDAAVEAAGASARVTEFTDTLDAGYDTMLDEGGGGLSGGQRQRVSVARAFLRNAPILILDEATSALDMKSEAHIQAALDELAQGHTTFIIAHRFSTIRMAQRILVFEEGRIIADGSHAELYDTCMLYRHLYDEQVRRDGQESGKEVAPC